ncbi:MAG TPA: hypothetical protein VEK79_05150 [Thermoanaerobaculia bacterium]|nr:hypothetical protein [Thermoanaerobaculia bacterium]
MRTRTIALTLVISAAAASFLTAGNRMSYIYKRGNVQTMRISGEFHKIAPIARKYGSEFVWIRLDGREYVIRDAATLADVRNLFRDVEALDPEIRAVERRLRPLEEQLDEVEERVDYAGDTLGDEDDLSDTERENLEDKLRVAEREMRELESKMKPLEREQERLDRESERREKIAEAKFEKLVERAIADGIAQRVQ